MRWACVLPASNPTQRAGHACTSNFEPSPRCTHTRCPHSGTPARLGFCSVSFSCGVMSPSTLVVLRCVVRGEPALRALLREELGELVSGVLASTVRPQSLDPHAVLRVYPHSICFICFERLILCAEHGQR